MAEVERLTGVSRHALRPDIYRLPDMDIGAALFVIATISRVGPR